MERKQNLISSLRVAINALENDTIKYNWNEQCSCNAGVVSQSVLGLPIEEFDKLRKPAFAKVEKINKEHEERDKIDLTWKNTIKYTCPITGKGMPQVFQELENAGLSRFDIAHLEYMDNSAILAESTIEKVRIKTGKRVVGQTQKEVIKSKYFGLVKEKVMESEDIVEDVFELRYPSDYFKKRENLVKYLSAWVRILEREHTTEDKSSKDNIEADLLNAVAEENYELAAELRNQIAKMF